MVDWFKSPNTWDELKKQNTDMREDILRKQHRIKELQSDLDVAKRNVSARIKIATDELEARQKKDTLDIERKLQQKYYDKLNEHMMTVNTEGTAQTKFVQELALKVFDKAPTMLK